MPQVTSIVQRLQILCVFLLSFHAFCAQKEILENFEWAQTSVFPAQLWQAREGDPKPVYTILSHDGNRYLNANDSGQSVQIFRKVTWKMKEFKHLQWRWRVNVFPNGADERSGSKNDSAAGVYVVFPKRLFIPDVIKYVWSEKAPIETKIDRKKRFPVMVIRSSEQEKGQWVLEKRNVYEDHKNLFGRYPQKVEAIGVLTDANNTKSTANADYDDFVLLSE